MNEAAINNIGLIFLGIFFAVAGQLLFWVLVWK
jgi:hypothetical protein